VHSKADETASLIKHRNGKIRKKQKQKPSSSEEIIHGIVREGSPRGVGILMQALQLSVLCAKRSIGNQVYTPLL